MIILQPSAGNSSGNNAVAAQEVGEVGNFAPRDLGGAEALFHEFKGGVAERGEGAFGAVEEAGEELVGEGVDAKRRFWQGALRGTGEGPHPGKERLAGPAVYAWVILRP